MGGRGSSGNRNSSNESSRYANMTKEELQAERQRYVDEVEEIATRTKGVMTVGSEDYNRLMSAAKERDEITYEIQSKHLSPFVKPEKFAELNATKGSKTELTADEAFIARQDLLRNKDVYMAVQSAMTGVAEGSNTAIDNMYEGKDGKKLYDNFKATREMLRKKYGDEVTLYRAGTDQTPKATINMTTSKANATQYSKLYGTKVMSTKVPVNDILLVNISRSGQYEEVVVLNKNKNLNKKRKK